MLAGKKYLKPILIITGITAAAASWMQLRTDELTAREQKEVNTPAVITDTELSLDVENAYGIPLEGKILNEGQVKRGQTLAGLLVEHGADYVLLDSLVRSTDTIFSARKMRTGRPYTIIQGADGTLEHFVYEIDVLEHVIYSFSDSVSVVKKKKPTSIEERFVEVELEGALYVALQEQGADPLISLALADAFAWTVDFYRIQKGDRFKVLYEQELVEGQNYGMPKIMAAHYQSGDKVLEGYRYAIEGEEQLFDAEGNSLKKAFLKAPLKFSRITSGYKNRRFHPVQKRWKSHKGTDYAAPRGTPIMSVGEGVVEKSSYTKGNGKYVKVRHNGTYSTQYLHMSKRLVKVGQRVSQGEAIGLVGSTGLATGPHVCFRFWKNGTQVDHRKEEFPSADPIPQDELAAFQVVKDALALRMQGTKAEQVKEVDF